MFTPPPEKKDAATIKREQKKARQVKPDPVHAASSLLAWWACRDGVHLDVGVFPSCPHQDERGGHSPLSSSLPVLMCVCGPYLNFIYYRRSRLSAGQRANKQHSVMGKVTVI